MRKFNCLREYRRSQRRYEEISSIFDRDRRRSVRGAVESVETGLIPFGSGVLALVVIGLLIFQGLAWTGL